MVIMCAAGVAVPVSAAIAIATPPDTSIFIDPAPLVISIVVPEDVILAITGGEPVDPIGICPSVAAESTVIADVPLPTTSEFAVILVSPVPPSGTVSGSETISG
jgi:hypothetical protein